MQMPFAFMLQASASFLDQFTFGVVIEAAIILFLAWLSIRWSVQLLEAAARRGARARFLAKWIEPVLRIVIWFVAVLLCFNVLAPSRETFLAGIASLGIALGLGAQDLVKNFVGGFVILADRPFQLGDRVKVGDAYGEIDYIGVNSTKLTTPDDTRVTIPNSQILTQQVYNANSGVADCQVVTDLYLPADTEAEIAHRVGLEAALCCRLLLVRKPVVVLTTHGFDRRPYLRLRIKCYVYDHRLEPRMQSDITARATRELIRLGLLQRWQGLDTAPHVEG